MGDHSISANGSLLVGVAVASAAGSALYSWCQHEEHMRATCTSHALAAPTAPTPAPTSPHRPITHSAGTSPLVPSLAIEAREPLAGRRKYSEASSEGLTCSTPSSPEARQCDSMRRLPLHAEEGGKGKGTEQAVHASCDLCHAEARPCPPDAHPTTTVTFIPDVGNPCFHTCHPTSVYYRSTLHCRQWWLTTDVFNSVCSFLPEADVLVVSGVNSSCLRSGIELFSRQERDMSRAVGLKKRRAARECMTKRRVGIKVDSFEALLQVTAAGPSSNLYGFTFVDSVKEGSECGRRRLAWTASDNRVRTAEVVKSLQETLDLYEKRKSAAHEWVQECAFAGIALS